jgi:hypothetical protein
VATLLRTTAKPSIAIAIAASMARLSVPGSGTDAMSANDVPSLISSITRSGLLYPDQ